MRAGVRRPGAIYPTQDDAAAAGSDIEFDSSSRTLGGLTPTAMTRNYAGLCANQYQVTLVETWATLVALVLEQSGVDPDRVTPEVRFVDDFGAD